MRILIINPNSDPEMTTAIEKTATDFAGVEFQVVCMSIDSAPRFIETYGDQLRTGPAMLQLVKSCEEAFDAFIVACHSDPNLDALKEASPKPVVGIGEASMKMATLLGHGFSVITTDKHSVPGKLALARKYHLDGSLVSVRAPERAAGFANDADMVLTLAKAAIDEDLAEVIVLGCAGFTGMDKRVQQQLGVPVLDGIVCALIIASGLVRYGVSTSKVRGYNPEA
jgi:allantoin racemase